MDQINKRIIDAIIDKAKRECPDSLALIGVYGSALTGDTHTHSDLDLLILINDQKGRCLADAFILDDLQIGYDLYCTTWEMLENDARCNQAFLSKLMDSSLVYTNDNSLVDRLEKIRAKTKHILASDQRKEKAFEILSLAKIAYADCCLADTLSEVRVQAGEVIYQLLNCIMIYHGRYFKKGVKRTFDELFSLNLPYDIKALVMSVISSESVENIRQSLDVLMKTVIQHMSFKQERIEHTAQTLSGTYEEMFSNWRNKMHEANQNNDLFSSFSNLVSFQLMLNDIGASIDVIKDFDCNDLYGNVIAYDNALTEYWNLYKNVGITPKIFKNADEFISAYLNK